MKVGTDGVLLGALANLPRAGRARNGFSSAGQLTGPYRMLDIGTGTGLVALMLAQRSAEQFASGHDVRIDAVELVSEAAGQAAENVAQSPWADRIRVIRQDFLAFYPNCTRRYDLIVSNPPYFRNSLKSASSEKALARHGSDEFLRKLLEGSRRLLKPDGFCCFIIPFGVASDLETLAAGENLAVRQRVSIRSKPGGKVIRQCLTLGNAKREAQGEVIEHELAIYEPDGSYSKDFTMLLRPFYLKF